MPGYVRDDLAGGLEYAVVSNGIAVLVGGSLDISAYEQLAAIQDRLSK